MSEHVYLLFGVMVIAAAIIQATGRIAAAVITGIAQNVDIKK